MLGPIDIPTIFFGGGTPSLIPLQAFDKILGQINKFFKISTDCEITLESNPGTIDNKN